MADALASTLRPLIAGESIVAVLLARDSPRLYAAQLAVLQAGGAHVCLDPSFPDQHVLHVLRDTAAVAVLTDAAGAQRVAAAGVRSFDVEALLASTSLSTRASATPHQSLPVQSPPVQSPCGASPCAASDHRLAYVIYTSGSTGVPKGVLIEHAGAVNLIAAGVERFGMGPDDRIAQGSSAAYDSSIEETWLAFGSGAAVVVLDDDTVRMGPDLAQWLRQQRVTVFCPPPTLMRAMDSRSPKDEMPDLRLCYVGGEALPSDLAALWGSAVWLENGYGPTECTVTVTRCRVHAGETVSIGIPVPPNRAFVLDENLQPVADGVAGELCIAGPAVARGYLGAPELTAQRFPVLPGIGRVYRSGDLGHRDAAGRLFCHGRIDSQVKVRGYRIELEAIEAVLAGCPGVREAACGVQGQDAGRLLVAHIVPDERGAPPFAELERCVRRALPEYMVPARFAVIAALPRTIGGKLNRKALPPIDGVVIHGDAAAAGRPQGERQQQLRAACAAVLGLRPEAVSVDDDFFALGGDSLRAAMLVSRLRRERESEPLAVRDVYSARTIRALAALAPEPLATGPALLRPLRQGGRPLLATALQTAWLAAAFAGAVSLLCLIGFWALPWLFATFDLAVLALLLPLLVAGSVLTYAAAALLLAVATKRLLIGRYRPMRAPVWSGFWVRHWIVVRMVRLVPWSLLRGTEFMNAALRLLGARIGRRVHIDREAGLLCGGWDLLSLGDDVSLGREVALGLCELDDGDLVVGAVTVGNGAVLEVRSGTGADVEIGAGARLQALAHLPAGTRLPAGERWDGVPARPCGRTTPPPAISVPGETLSPWRFGWQLVMARVLLSPLATLPLTLVVAVIAAWLSTDGAGLAAWLTVAGPWSQVPWCVAVLVLAVAALPLSLLLQALVLRWSLPVPAGTHDRWSQLHLRHMLRNDALEAAGEWLAGTLFWPQWLRLAGMRIGRDCEISTIACTLPEHVAIGGGSFLADGIYLGVCDVQAGTVTVAPTELGVRTFLGNHVVVPAGQRLPDDVLLGVCTVADMGGMAAGTAWFGQPPFGLPRREIVRADPRLTHRPGTLRYLVRVFWEAMRFALPAVPALLWLWWFEAVAPAAQLGWWPGLAAAFAATLAVGLCQLAIVLASKWALLGRVRPGQHGLWSAWANRWDFHYVVWERCGRPLLSHLEGTLWLGWFLRAIGVRVGRRAVLGDGFAQVVDPDMLAIGDGATVQALFQAHSFEDRVLKLDRVHIGRGANLGRGAVVLYGADVGDGAQVAPHSVVMKHERLSAGRHYAGVPTAEVAAAVPALRRAGRR